MTDAYGEGATQIALSAIQPNPRQPRASFDANELAELAESAGSQWTGTFNPRPFSESEALEVYQCAY